MTDPAEFERRLFAWLDGELPPGEAAEMDALVRASPELEARVAAERAFDARVARAMSSDAGDAAASVRAMLARARREAPAAAAHEGRVVRFPAWALRSVAAAVLVVVTGMWWFCIPPFECAYLSALEQATHDPKVLPCPTADEMAARFALPEEFGGTRAAPPYARADLSFATSHCAAVRCSYVSADRPDLSLCVFACDSGGVRPSFRRETVKDGESWWISEIGGTSVVAFEGPTKDCVYAVTGPSGDAAVFESAKRLRRALR